MVPFSVGPFLERNVWTKRGPMLNMVLERAGMGRVGVITKDA